MSASDGPRRLVNCPVRDRHLRLKRKPRPECGVGPRPQAATNFAPDELKVLGQAFDGACEELGIARSRGTAREYIAKLILRLARQGQSDAHALQAQAVGKLLAQGATST